MPLLNTTIMRLNEITTRIKNKNQLSADDESFIKQIFMEINEDGETYDLTSRIIENVMESDILDELIPVSTENNEGIVELVASISRIIDKGE